MKFLLLFLLASFTCAAGTPWTAQDYALEGTTIAALALDWRQTSNIHLDNCIRDNLEYHREELNPILGKHPSQQDINQYFAVSAAVHVLVAAQLSGRWRTAWQMTWIGLEVGTVERNYKLGIRLNF